MEGDVAGDFYDVIDLRDGRVAVIVGDAPGFGHRAAALADELRAELRRGFGVTDDVRGILRRVDDRLGALDAEVIATVATAVIDPAARTVELSSAGHLPPVVTDDSASSFLNGDVDPPLGVPAERSVTHHRLSSTSTLFLYTDGLIERRGTPLHDSLAVLRDSVSGLHNATAWASELARRTTARLGQPADDATVVSVRLLPAGGRQSAVGATPIERGHVVLRLYVDPEDLRSSQAEAMVRDLAHRLDPRLDVHVEVVDVGSGGGGEADGVLAVPMIVRQTPHPQVRVIGRPSSVADLARRLQLPLSEQED